MQKIEKLVVALKARGQKRLSLLPPTAGAQRHFGPYSKNIWLATSPIPTDVPPAKHGND